MSEPARIALRLLGLLLFGFGLALVVLLFVPGPRDLADWMGNNCAHTKDGPAEQCTVFDVLGILFIGPLLILIGGVMAAALRPPGKGPVTIDLSRVRRRGP